MKEIQKKFLLAYIVLAATLTVLGFVIFWFFLPQYYLPVFPVLLILFSFITILSHFVLLNSLKSPKKSHFTNVFMLSIMGRLFIYLIFFGVYIYLFKSNIFAFTIVFLLFYIIFTFFEVTTFLKMLKKTEPKN